MDQTLDLPKRYLSKQHFNIHQRWVAVSTPKLSCRASSGLARVSLNAAPSANNLAVLDQREERPIVLAPVVIRAYEGQDNLASFATDPERTADFTTSLNPASLVVVSGAKVEASVLNDASASQYQFERTGYFVHDAIDSTPERPVFNRTVTLRDSWAKVKGG